MTTTTSNSQVLTLVANTAFPATWSVWFDTIVVTNLTADPVYVTTDGTAATVGENGSDVVLPGAVTAFANRGVKPDITKSTWPGQTQVSVIGGAAGTVVVSPQ